MKLFRTRFGLRSMLGMVGLCALVFWAIKVSRDSEPARLYSGWLGDGDESRRFQAAQELGKLSEETDVAIPSLVRAMLTDNLASVRRQSAISLAKIASRSNDDRTIHAVTRSVLKALKDQDPTVRRAAADALGQIGADLGAVIPALLEASSDQDEWVRGASIAALGLVERKAQLDQDESRRAILGALKDPCLHVREMGVYAFQAVGERSPSFSIASLQDPDSRVRLAVMLPLSRHLPMATRVIPELTAALADSDPAVRAGAATVLGNVGPIPSSVVTALEKTLSDPDQAVRNAGSRALANRP
jgi:HEAT repeat protein